MRPGPKLLLLFLLVSLAMAASPASAPAQSVDILRDEVRRLVATSSNFTSTLAQVANMTVAPEVSSAHYKIEFPGQDDVDMNLTKVPVRHYFRAPNRDWSPFVQVSGGYMTASKTLREEEDGNQILADRQHWGYSGQLTGGVEYSLADWFMVRPMAGAGLVRLKNETTPLNQYTRDVVMPVYKGIIGDYTIDAMALSAGVELNLKHALGPVNLELAFSYSHFYLQSIDVSDSALEFHQNSDVTALRLTLGGQMGGLTLAGYPLLWQVFGGNVTWWGPDAEDLGFSHYWETGATLGLDLRQTGLFIDALRLGGSLVTGDGITGWSMILGYGF